MTGVDVDGNGTTTELFPGSSILFDAVGGFGVGQLDLQRESCRVAFDVEAVRFAVGQGQMIPFVADATTTSRLGAIDPASTAVPVMIEADLQPLDQSQGDFQAQLDDLVYLVDRPSYDEATDRVLGHSRDILLTTDGDDVFRIDLAVRKTADGVTTQPVPRKIFSGDGAQILSLHGFQDFGELEAVLAIERSSGSVLLVVDEGRQTKELFYPSNLTVLDVVRTADRRFDGAILTEVNPVNGATAGLLHLSPSGELELVIGGSVEQITTGSQPFTALVRGVELFSIDWTTGIPTVLSVAADPSLRLTPYEGGTLHFFETIPAFSFFALFESVNGGTPNSIRTVQLGSAAPPEFGLASVTDDFVVIKLNPLVFGVTPTLGSFPRNGGLEIDLDPVGNFLNTDLGTARAIGNRLFAQGAQSSPFARSLDAAGLSPTDFAVDSRIGGFIREDSYAAADTRGQTDVVLVEEGGAVRVLDPSSPNSIASAPLVHSGVGGAATLVSVNGNRLLIADVVASGGVESSDLFLVDHTSGELAIQVFEGGGNLVLPVR